MPKQPKPKPIPTIDELLARKAGELSTFVVCRLCGRELGALGTHLHFAHEMTVATYQETFPNEPVSCEDMRVRVARARLKRSRQRVKGNFSYWTYAEAKAILAPFRLADFRSFQEWLREHPDHRIPALGNIVARYQPDWISWGDFLGNDYRTVWEKNGQFLPFADARAYARKLGLASKTEWKRWSNSGERPSNVPGSPYTIYRDSGWTNWGDFLGTGTVAPKQRKFLPFAEAREYARSLKLPSSTAWEDWAKSGKRPQNIPSHVVEIYRNQGWTDWNDFLGIPTLLPFAEAREYARTLNLSTRKEWEQWCSSGRRPAGIPRLASRAYRDSGWLDWCDFLGADPRKRNRSRKFLSFTDARDYVQTLKLLSMREWTAWSRSGKRPTNIPGKPDNTYRNSGWNGWPDFLGYKTRTFLPFAKARAYARTVALPSKAAWQDFSAAGKLPANVPCTPDRVYRDQGWNGWPDFLGFEKRVLLSFEEARAYARNLGISSSRQWQEWCQSGDCPSCIPKVPSSAYRDSGWLGWRDFLGTENPAPMPLPKNPPENGI